MKSIKTITNIILTYRQYIKIFEGYWFLLLIVKMFSQDWSREGKMSRKFIVLPLDGAYIKNLKKVNRRPVEGDLPNDYGIFLICLKPSMVLANYQVL